MPFTPSREHVLVGNARLDRPRGLVGAPMCARLNPVLSLPLSLSLSRARARARVPVMSRRLRGASTLITYPYTRVPTVCLPTDGSNE